jgi:hypothetical protein
MFPNQLDTTRKMLERRGQTHPEIAATYMS